MRLYEIRTVNEYQTTVMSTSVEQKMTSYYILKCDTVKRTHVILTHLQKILISPKSYGHKSLRIAILHEYHLISHIVPERL